LVILLLDGAINYHLKPANAFPSLLCDDINLLCTIFFGTRDWMHAGY